MTTGNPTVQRPKRPHVVPEMLLKHFQDGNEQVLAYRKNDSKFFHTSPKNVFVNKHRHTLRGEEYRGNPFEIETRLGEIESEAAPVIDKIVRCRKTDLYPSLTEEEGDAVKLFLITLFLRTDYHADEIVPIDRYSQDFRLECFKQGAKLGFDQAKVQDVLHQTWFGARVEEAWHDHRARLAIGEPPKVADEIERYMRVNGLMVATRDKRASGFILGDCGGVRVDDPRKEGAYHSWLPVSREVVIGATNDPENVLYMKLKWQDVNRINQTTFANSKIVVSRRPSDLDYVLLDREVRLSRTRQ